MLSLVSLSLPLLFVTHRSSKNTADQKLEAHNTYLEAKLVLEELERERAVREAAARALAKGEKGKSKAVAKAVEERDKATAKVGELQRNLRHSMISHQVVLPPLDIIGPFTTIVADFMCNMSAPIQHPMQSNWFKPCGSYGSCAPLP